jgi:hypothetical protein
MFASAPCLIGRDSLVKRTVRFDLVRVFGKFPGMRPAPGETGDAPKWEPRVPNYSIYIDEAGDPSIPISPIVPESQRYLGLTGVIIERGKPEEALRHDLAVLKVRHLGVEHGTGAVLHRKDILNAKGPFTSLQNPEVRHAFDEDLKRTIKSAPITIISVVLDKWSHAKKYINPWDAYHWCLCQLVEQYAWWLRIRKVTGDVFAESRGGVEDTGLKEAFHELMTKGTNLQTVKWMQEWITSTQLKVRRKSADMPALEIADLLAYPMKQDIIRRRGALASDPGPFGQDLCRLIEPKLHRHYQSGDIDQFGRRFIA